MEAKDGSVGFAFSGTYEEVVTNARIVYRLEDGRQVIVSFEDADEGVTVTEIFDAEQVNSLELQEKGWQSILDNFKRYTERLKAATE
jgi:uncharacterized protein YndB with AHSA1/START domain